MRLARYHRQHLQEYRQRHELLEGHRIASRAQLHHNRQERLPRRRWHHFQVAAERREDSRFLQDTEGEALECCGCMHDQNHDARTPGIS